MQDYHLYFPMTLNTNKQLIARANTTIDSSTYDMAPSDCEYNSTNAKGQRTVRSKDCGSCVATAFSRAADDWKHSQAGVQWVAWAQISLVACRPVALARTHAQSPQSCTVKTVQQLHQQPPLPLGAGSCLAAADPASFAGGWTWPAWWLLGRLSKPTSYPPAP
jgi:hypothetical protein